jgi:uncharacterized protein (TIGR03437 family)
VETLRRGRFDFGCGTRVLVRIDSAVASAITLEEPHRAATSMAHSADAGRAPGTTVTFAGIPMPLLSVQAQQIVAIVPFRPGGPDSTPVLQVEREGAVSNSILLPVLRSAIEVLSAINADGSVNSAEQPAPGGSVVTFFGAGFGQMSPEVGDGGINASGPANFFAGALETTLGDRTGQIVYAGPRREWSRDRTGECACSHITRRFLHYPALIGWAPVGRLDYHGLTIWIR